MTRVLTIMGSGETAPTMVKVHRRIIERVTGPAVLLDTPYGFQENADDITARAVQHFRVSINVELGVASWRRADSDVLSRETALTRLREAGYVFAGPGSPSYALAQWAGGEVPMVLQSSLEREGAVTFASAAALTLGVATVPVYEIYKVGQEPAWLIGLDLLGATTGLTAAVIPHYDNAEGGNHDTRFCYLGERRLALMEVELADDAFVLGVDEHTGLVIDLDTGSAEVVGIGQVTVRNDGRSTTFPTGSTVTVEDLRRAAFGGAVATSVAAGAGSRRLAGHDEAVGEVASVGASGPLGPLAEAERLDTEFSAALARRDVPAAVAAILELDDVLVAWSRDTLDSDEPDRARTVLRSMVVRLGELAVGGAADPREVLGPVVEVALAERSLARSSKDFAASDRIRDALAAAGVEVRDTPNGQEWVPAG